MELSQLDCGTGYLSLLQNPHFIPAQLFKNAFLLYLYSSVVQGYLVTAGPNECMHECMDG